MWPEGRPRSACFCVMPASVRVTVMWVTVVGTMYACWKLIGGALLRDEKPLTGG